MSKAFGLVALVALSLLTCLGGCASTSGAAGDSGGQPAAATAGAQKNVVFFKTTVDKPNATYGDGYRFAYILMKYRMGDDAGAKLALGADQCKDELIKAGVMSNGWAEDSNELLTHETAAYLLAKAMNIKGGALFALTGTTRYAHREMVDRGLLPRSNPRQYITGAQLTSAFRDSKAYMESKQ